ncbi:MAG TPA: hypothetical protein VEU96_21065 [Bryobacteraceae bacterium]|nr:hypothetical protein [Bryobacteraceae bacterium]
MDASPIVARPGQKIKLRYRMLGNVDFGRIIRPDQSIIPLTDETGGVFSVDVIAPTPGVRDVFSPILGEVRGYISSTAKCFNNSFVQVITDEVPKARVVHLATDVQRADYVVNITIPAASFPALDALVFSFDPTPIAKRFYQFFGDDYDMLNFVLPGFYENRFHVVVKNTEQGTAVPIMDTAANYGSKGRLIGVNIFPLFPYYDGAERGNTHEIGHQWLAHFPRLPYAVPPHWPPSSMANGIMGFGHATGTQGLEFPCLISRKNGIVTAKNSPPGSFTDMDLYVMGLIPPDQVGEHFIVTDINVANQMPDVCDTTLAPSQYTVLTANDIIRDYGPRIPAASPGRQLRIANILVTRDTPADADTMALADFFARRFQERSNVPIKVGLARRLGDSMYTATGKLASVSTQLTTTAMPEIGAGGIVNVGNYAAGARLAPGTPAAIFGVNLASAAVAATNVPLTTTLGGVQVLVNGVPAPLYYVSPTQINFQLPWELNTANETYADEAGASFLPMYSVRVQNGDVSSNLAYITGQQDSPQIMIYGDNLAVAQDSAYNTIGPNHPAKPGETIIVYMLGVNSLTAKQVTGAPAPSDSPVRFNSPINAKLGGISAIVDFAGLTPGSIGLEQVNVRVPNLQPGTYDLTLSVNGFPSNTVKLIVGTP